MNFVMLFVQPKNQQMIYNERQLDYNGFCDGSIPTPLPPRHAMPVALATVTWNLPGLTTAEARDASGVSSVGCICSGIPFNLGGNALQFIAVG
jgi:hypothetical protein